MKILYAFQGTGNGHLSRAKDLIPLLRTRGEVDVLVSGPQTDLPLSFDVRYRFTGLGFVFGKDGGIDYWKTYKKSNLKRLFGEISQVPVDEYDLVINDFEPVSAWACFLRRKACVGLSHQIAVVHPKSPKPPKKDPVGMAVLKYYAPVTSRYGFHFLPYGHHIFQPVIRQEVRRLKPTDKGHYTVYLPAYGDKKIIAFLSRFPDVRWDVFSKHTALEYAWGNVYIHPLHNERFLKSLAGAKGVICGAGFETPAEVLYLKKKLLVVPMKGQYEQQCNAAALRLLGVPVIKKLNKGSLQKLDAWLQSTEKVMLPFNEETEELIDLILSEHGNKKRARAAVRDMGGNRFRALVWKKVFGDVEVG